MEYQAQLRFVRVTPRKMGLLVDQIRGKSVNEALNFLSLSPDNLFVKTALVGKGPTLKRFRPRAKGSASPILKRTSHVTLSVAEK
jgi:large subunit ribosomal protein L22